MALEGGSDGLEVVLSQFVILIDKDDETAPCHRDSLIACVANTATL